MDADVGGYDLWVNLPRFTATVSGVALRSGPYKGAATSNYIRPSALEVSGILGNHRRGHSNKQKNKVLDNL